MPADVTAPDFSNDLALALSLADAADQISMDRFGARDLVIETKPDLTPVSDADQAVERTIRNLLSVDRPQDAILGEEFGSTEGRRQWILDPIDGTKNYVRGVPVWATLIALKVDDDIAVGVVSAPALGRRWWAMTGGGAFTTSPGAPAARRINCSLVTSINDASFSFSDAVGWDTRGAEAGLAELLRTTWRQRAYGDFWSHMMVAEGVVDIAAEPVLETYDMAALIPIVQEAGGRITSFAGGSALGGGSALTTNALLHDQVALVLRG